MVGTDLDLTELWPKVVDEVKKRVLLPRLWVAMEAAIPVTMDRGFLVLGLKPEDTEHAGMLSPSETRTKLNTIIHDLTGQDVQIRLIDGTSVEEWEAVKRRDAIVEAARAVKRQEQQRESVAFASWESLSEELHAIYSRTPSKQFPQGRALFLSRAVPLVSDAMDRLGTTGSGGDQERGERTLARILDKVGQLADVSGTIVAYEVFRYRSRQKAAQPS
ncbi:MAG TPA: hypothetical protein VGN26_09995 [Armatimonadota bacterium]